MNGLELQEQFSLINWQEDRYYEMRASAMLGIETSFHDIKSLVKPFDGDCLQRWGTP